MASKNQQVSAALCKKLLYSAKSPKGQTFTQDPYLHYNYFTAWNQLAYSHCVLFPLNISVIYELAK